MSFESISLADDLVMFRCLETHWPSSCNIYLIKEAGGLTIIDSGIGREDQFDQFKEQLNRHGWQLTDIHKIILTHGHSDHAGGALWIKEASGAAIYLPELDLREVMSLKWHLNFIMPDFLQRYFPEMEAWGDLECALFLNNLRRNTQQNQAI